MATKKKAEASTEIPRAEQLDEEIRAAAQKLYEERCARTGKGDQLSDWLEAEKAVRRKHGHK
ncbi:MAG: hypothetical protein ACLQMF_07910 [Rectinemataceae bacterium]